MARVRKRGGGEKKGAREEISGGERKMGGVNRAQRSWEQGTAEEVR